MSEDNKKEYYAFISYKREDEKWAKWLQDKLEHYKFPTNLNGRTDLPKNIRPTFRDVTDLTPGLLADEIDKALRSSEWLIVICSPRSAKSPWVCKEAQTFIDLGRADHIIPFVIEGNPFSKDSSTECYPEALLNLTDGRELLAANINEMGRDAAAIKVVSRMFNLRFDILWQRHERNKRKYLHMASTLLLVVVCAALMIVNYFKTINDKLLINQSRYLVKEIEQLINDGDLYTAQLLALEALPKSSSIPNRPYVPEAEAVLRKIHNNISEVRYTPDSIGFRKYYNYKYVADSIRQINYKSVGVIHTKYAPGYGFSPSGDTLAVVINKNTLSLFDSRNGQELSSKSMEVDLNPAFSFSSDGKYIVFSSSSPIIYDVSKEKFHPIANDLKCKGVWFNKKNDIIIIDGDYNIILHNIKDGKIAERQLCDNAKKYIRIVDVAISNDYNYIAVHLRFDDLRNPSCYTINVYQTEDLKLIDSFNISDNYTYNFDLVFTDDYKILYPGADCYEMRDLFDKKIVETTLPSSKEIFDCNNGRLLYDGGIYNLLTLRNIQEFKYNVWSGKFTVDGNTFALGCDNNVRIMKTGKEYMSDSFSYTLNNSKDKDSIYQKLNIEYAYYESSAGYELLHCMGKIDRLFHTPTNDIVLKNKDTDEDVRITNAHNDIINGVSFSPSKNKIISVSNDSTVKIWNANTFVEEICFDKHKAPTSVARIAPNEQLIMSADSLNNLLIWSINDQKIINSCRFSDEEIQDINFNKNGSMIAISLSNKVDLLGRTEIVETKTLKSIQTINDVAEETDFSYCGNFVLLYDELFGKAWGRIYDLESGLKIDDVHYSEFSKCGNFLVNRNNYWRLSGGYTQKLDYCNYLSLENLIKYHESKMIGRVLNDKEKKQFSIIQ